MAAMSIGKTAILRLSKSVSQNPSLSFRPKISRVCFTSASKYSEGQHAAGDDRRKEYSPYNADESVQEPANAAGDAMRETMDKTKQKTGEMKDNAEYMKDQASDAASKAADKAKETKDRAMESSHDARETMKDKAQDMNEKSKETLGSMADKAYDMREGAMDNAGEMADKTKGYVAETVSEKAKQTVQGAWDAAKGTAEKVKETVVGTNSSSSEDDVDDLIEGHVKKPARESKEKVMDQDVVDSTRKSVESRDQNKY